MEAIIYNIQRFSLHDGGGIRTILFFKGCPLRCAWCSNPESQKKAPVIMVNKRICLGCGACIAACGEKALTMGEDGVSIDKSLCTACGNCAEVCPSNAMRMAGKAMQAGELVEKALVDRPYYQNSSGGVTLSGGEPLAQADAAFCVLSALKAQGIHTAVETCGYTEPEVLTRLAPYVDQFMFDYKLHDAEKHEFYTGVGNEPILASLRHLKHIGADILLRLPLIPGINMDEAHYAGASALVNDLRLRNVEVLPFHQYGKGKYDELGMGYRCADVRAPEKEAVEKAKEYLRKATTATVW